ncbi:MAG TPA: carboxymuconolactone decarboxylase family protein [Candidatus Angelobacter sp.]|nr:carboxymuconolactone decarboxylase family protein [Candidatus Angelobacter sp.]
MRLRQPRVQQLTPSELDPETQQMLEGMRVDGKIFNLFTTLAHHPQLMKRWLVFASHILGKSTLPERDRELVILRMGWLSRAEYEWGHHVAIGKRIGLTEEEIERVSKGPEAPGWASFDAALLRAADELHADSIVGDSTWKELSARYTTQQMLDLVFTAGQYKMVSMVLNSVGVQLEEGFQGFAGGTSASGA